MNGTDHTRKCTTCAEACPDPLDTCPCLQCDKECCASCSVDFDGPFCSEECEAASEVAASFSCECVMRGMAFCSGLCGTMTCSTCNGGGYATPQKACPSCNGSGRLIHV